MAEPQLFAQPEATPWTEVAPGNRRRVLVHTPELMQVEFAFEEGAVGALHSHPHVQSSYVAEGRFEVTIAGRTEVIGEGGSFIVPSGLVHGVRALERGRLVDSFTPARQDFL
jgi:quercetin dioxygenase-like cupin family protein